MYYSKVAAYYWIAQVVDKIGMTFFQFYSISLTQEYELQLQKGVKMVR